MNNKKKRTKETLTLKKKQSEIFKGKQQGNKTEKDIDFAKNCHELDDSNDNTYEEELEINDKITNNNEGVNLNYQQEDKISNENNTKKDSNFIIMYYFL